MTSTSHDVSDTIDPAIKSLLNAVKQIAQATDVAWFLTGAMARDLVLELVHGIEAGRRTEDIDLGFMVESWAAYEALKTNFLMTDEFIEDSRRHHRLYYHDAISVDLIPFGAIEHSDGTIAWPPDQETKMQVAGFEDAWRHSLRLKVSQEVEIAVVSLPGLTLLKLFAWHDRYSQTPGKDAPDLALLLQRYIDAGNLDRLYEEYDSMLTAEEFVLETAGPRLLGRDVASISSENVRTLLLDILRRETDVEHSNTLVNELARYLPDRNADTALSLLSKLRQGIEESTGNAG